MQFPLWRNSGGKMKKILLTGASGFLGSRIASFYAQKYEIYTPAHAELDITDEGSVRRMAETYRPDVVIHCAAVSDVGQCEKEPERSWKINVDGSINLAKAAGDVQAKCMICSSDQVYFGSSFSGAHREEEALSPCNLYGQEKLRAEQECLRANPDCVLLRLSWTLSFIIISILLGVLIHLLDIIARLPGINSINHVGGLIVGALEGLVIVWILFFVITLCQSSDWGGAMMQEIQENPLLKLLYENNVIEQIL